MHTAFESDLTKTQVILQMIVEITRNPRITPSELQKKLGISRDKYHRYINELSPMIPITYSRRERRFSITPPASFPDILRKPDEFYTLLMMVHVLTRREGTCGSDALRDFAKFMGLEAEFSRMLTYCVEMGPAASTPEQRESLLIINRAILGGRKIRFGYSDRERKASIVELAPYRIVHDKHWYLMGLRADIGEIRHFKILRMKDVAILDESFPMPEHVEVSHVGLPWDFGKREPTVVRIEFCGPAVASILEQRFHETQQIRELPDGVIELAVTVRAPEKMVPWILYFTKFARVVEPASLQRAVREELEATMARYR